MYRKGIIGNTSWDMRALKNLKMKINYVSRIYKRMPNFTHELVFDLNLMFNFNNESEKGGLERSSYQNCWYT
jgi:hypothetical protein